MASGHVNRVNRPNTWLHRPMLQNVKKALANSEPSTHGTNRTSAMSDLSLLCAAKRTSGRAVTKSAFDRWSQPVDATLYLRGKRWSVAMDREFRRGFTTAEKTELWDRWQRGESLKAIGRAFGKPSSSIYFQVSPYGGIRPAPRRRSRLALTLSEREEISRGIAVQRSAR